MNFHVHGPSQAAASDSYFSITLIFISYMACIPLKLLLSDTF